MLYSAYKRKLAGLKSLSPRTGWQGELRAALTSYLAMRPVRQPAPSAAPLRFAVFARPLTISLTLVLVLAVSATGVAAQQSLPTGLLYPVKLATEQVRLALTPSATGKTHLRLSFAQARLAEATSLVRQLDSNPPALERTLGRYEDEMHAVAALAPAVVAATTGGAQQEFLKGVRLQLVAQQETLRHVTADDSVGTELSSVRTSVSTSPRVKIKLLRALKASSEGEAAALPVLADSELEAESAADALAVPPLLPVIVPQFAPLTNEKRGPQGDDGRGRSSQSLPTGIVVGGIATQLVSPAAGSAPEAAVGALERAQRELTQARAEHDTPEGSSGYVRAYKRALKSYQSALDAELDLESHRQPGDQRDN